MIYLDYNATTPLCDDAREAMLPYLNRHFGNPSSVHAAGRAARAAVDNARDKLAALLYVKPHELIFTSGGTESCNLAVLGLARCSSSRGGHVISNKAEHHAVLNALEYLEKCEGFDVTWLNVSREGFVDLDQLAAAIRPETRLVSIMSANNETGVIQPIHEISRICRERGVLVHVTPSGVSACQARIRRRAWIGGWTSNTPWWVPTIVRARCKGLALAVKAPRPWPVGGFLGGIGGSAPLPGGSGWIEHGVPQMPNT